MRCCFTSFLAVKSVKSRVVSYWLYLNFSWCRLHFTKLSRHKFETKGSISKGSISSMSFIFRYYSFCLITLLFSWLIWSFTGRSCVCLLRLWGDLRVTIFLIIRRFYFHLEFNIEWKKQSKWCYWIFFILSRWNYLFVGGIEQSETPTGARSGCFDGLVGRRVARSIWG